MLSGMGHGVAHAATDRVVGRDFADVAACRAGAGVAVCSGAVIIELRGRPVALRGLLRRMAGRRVGVGTAVYHDGAWLLSRAPSRALVVALHSRDMPAGLLAEACATSDLAVSDVSRTRAVIAVAGPRCEELLARVALGAAPEAAVVRPAGDRALLVVAATGVVHAREALLRAGRDLGAAAVGPHAIELLSAAERVVACQRTIERALL